MQNIHKNDEIQVNNIQSINDKLQQNQNDITNFCLNQPFFQPVCECQQKYKITSRFEQVQVQKEQNLLFCVNLQKDQTQQHKNQTYHKDQIEIYEHINNHNLNINIYDSIPICMQRQTKTFTSYQNLQNFNFDNKCQKLKCSFQLLKQSNFKQNSHLTIKNNQKKVQGLENFFNVSQKTYKNIDDNIDQKIKIPNIRQYEYNSKTSSPIQSMLKKQLKQESILHQNLQQDTQNRVKNKNITINYDQLISHLKEQDLLSYVQILQKRNLTILTELETTKNKNSQLIRLLQIFTSEKQLQLSSQQKQNKILKIQSQKNDLQLKISRLSLSNQKLQAENRYLKQLVISANRNYQDLQQKNIQINDKYFQLLEQRQFRQNQFKTKVQELKNIFQKVLKIDTSDEQKYQSAQTPKTKVEQQRFMSLKREPLKQRSFQKNFNAKIQKNQFLDRTKLCSFGITQQSFKQTKQRQKESVDQNYRKIFLKTLATKGKK